MTPESSGALAGRVATSVPAALVVTLLVGCQTTNPLTRGAGVGGDERGIQIAAMDFITDHYVPDLESRNPTVYCVGFRPTGRVQAGPDLLQVSNRNERWDPGASVLRLLRDDQDREVLPLSACSWDAQAREIQGESGDPAVSFVAGPVHFETPGLALVTVEARESGYAGGRFGCRVERRVEGWTVDTCV